MKHEIAKEGCFAQTPDQSPMTLPRQLPLPQPVLNCSQQRNVNMITSSVIRGFKRNCVHTLGRASSINYKCVIWCLFAMADRIAYCLHRRKVDTELWLYSVWLQEREELAHSTEKNISLGDYSCLNAAAAAGLSIALFTMQSEVGRVEKQCDFNSLKCAAYESYQELNGTLEPMVFGETNSVGMELSRSSRVS